MKMRPKPRFIFLKRGLSMPMTISTTLVISTCSERTERNFLRIIEGSYLTQTMDTLLLPLYYVKSTEKF